MSENYIVSIVMPAYNCEKFITKAIESILSQTYQNFELLIADDASTDNTRKIIDSFHDSRIKCYHNEKNLGYLRTSNLLFEKCSGNFITFQDADDYSSRCRLQKMVDAFQKDESLMCVGSFVKRISEVGVEDSDLIFETRYDKIKSELPKVFNCVGSALMVKKNILDKIGPFNLFFDRLGSEDLYWYALIALNYKTTNLPEFLYYYRKNTNSVSQEKNKSCKKTMSMEFARHGIIFYLSSGKEIFNSKFKIKVLSHYLIGKCNCWNSDVFIGLIKILFSISLNPFGYPERYQLIKLYIPVLFKNLINPKTKPSVLN